MRDSEAHELSSFWLRKTGKAVLAVLLTKKADGTVNYWRGMNVRTRPPRIHERRTRPVAAFSPHEFRGAPPPYSPLDGRARQVEVSMPTGTLCAERNAIGNALAADQSIERSDMLAVAVLSVSLHPDADHAAISESTGELGDIAMVRGDLARAAHHFEGAHKQPNPRETTGSHGR